MTNTLDTPHHVNPGPATTVNPIIINDSFREKRIKYQVLSDCRTGNTLLILLILLNVAWHYFLYAVVR
jgi:hypothetical protein